MKKITITFPNKSTVVVENGIKAITLLNHFDTSGQKILAVSVNNKICSLEETIDISANLEPVYENTKEGSAIYRRSLCFVLATAAHNVFPKAHLLVGHSLEIGRAHV